MFVSSFFFHDIRRECIASFQDITIVDSNNSSRNIPYGLVLWASGIGNVPFVTKLLKTIDAQKGNRVVKVNERLQLIGVPDVYALGDCAMLSPKPMANDAERLFQVCGSVETHLTIPSGR